MNWPACEQDSPNGQAAERLCLCLLTPPQPTVLQTIMAQFGLPTVTCGDACGVDRSLRPIPRMSHVAKIGDDRAWTVSLRICDVGLSCGLSCSASRP